MSYSKSEYNEAKLNGMCTKHHNVKAEEGTTLCTECKRKAKERRERNKFKNACPSHPSRPISEGRTRCQECLDINRIGSEQRRIEALQKGMCLVHKLRPAAPGKTVCQQCLEYNIDRYEETKLEVFRYYGFKCACIKCPCPEPGLSFLTIDHVNNDGAKHRKETKRLYHWLKAKNFPQGFQTLCYNCNLAKGKNGGICPHISNCNK